MLGCLLVEVPTICPQPPFINQTHQVTAHENDLRSTSIVCRSNLCCTRIVRKSFGGQNDHHVLTVPCLEKQLLGPIFGSKKVADPRMVGFLSKMNPKKRGDVTLRCHWRLLFICFCECLSDLNQNDSTKKLINLNKNRESPVKCSASGEW